MILLYQFILIPIAYFDLNLALIPLETTPALDSLSFYVGEGGTPGYAAGEPASNDTKPPFIN